jgi:uncharacterized protein YkwD
MPARRRAAASLACALGLAIGIAAPAGAASVATDDPCVAPAPLDAEHLATHADATVCLLNEERAARGLSRLTVNWRLSDAALAHTREMVDHGFLAHTSPSGVSVVTRLRRARYILPTVRWHIGEVLGFGRGEEGTPAAIVAAWMESGSHRSTILDPRFRDIGLAISTGVPGEATAEGATYAVDFGARAARRARASKRRG